jgi:hypothetical protein
MRGRVLTNILFPYSKFVVANRKQLLDFQLNYLQIDFRKILYTPEGEGCCGADYSIFQNILT